VTAAFAAIFVLNVPFPLIVLAPGIAGYVGGVLAVDILEHPQRGPLVGEVNYAVEFRETEEATGADIAGVRGAACDHGREGQVRESRVRKLVAARDFLRTHHGDSSAVARDLTRETSFR